MTLGEVLLYVCDVLFGILWVILILFTQMVTQPRSQGPLLHGARVGEDPGNEVDGYHLTH